MASYTVKSGDTLSSIAKKLGVKSWQDLYNLNKKVIGSNPNLIYRGQVLSYGAGGSSGGSSGGTTPPSTGIGQTIADQVEDPTRQNFIKKYGLEEDLRPDAMFSAVAEERVNPEQLRNAATQMKALDWQRAISGSGARASGSTLLARQQALAQLEQQRRTAANTFEQAQRQLFNTWYNQEMQNYMTSKAPSAYQLNKFGIETPWTGGTTEVDTSQKYGYTPAFDIRDVFKFGGYTRPAAMYNMPTPIS